MPPSENPTAGARFAAACRRAGRDPWREGMLMAYDPTDTEADNKTTVRIVWLDYDGWAGMSTDPDDNHELAYTVAPTDTPDLSDAATRGAAIEVLREWSGDATLHVKAERYLTVGWLWVVHGATVTRWERKPTEAEAIAVYAEHLSAEALAAVEGG